MKKTYEQIHAEKQAKRLASQKLRAESKKNAEVEAKTVHEKFRRILYDCGLTPRQLSNCAGVTPATISRCSRGYNKSIRLEIMTAVLRAAGYRIEFVPLEPKEDEFRSIRRVPLPPA
jgi:DNA-binding Xre family transcriptional regulator